MNHDKEQKRETMSAEDMDAIAPHPSWGDGRHGFLLCRFNAILDKARRLRAEITWDDDGDDNEGGEPTIYCDPRLWIETNRPYSETDPSLTTWDGREIALTNEDAVVLASGDPLLILNIYAGVIERMSVWSPADGYSGFHIEGGEGE